MDSTYTVIILSLMFDAVLTPLRRPPRSNRRQDRAPRRLGVPRSSTLYMFVLDFSPHVLQACKTNPARLQRCSRAAPEVALDVSPEPAFERLFGAARPDLAQSRAKMEEVSRRLTNKRSSPKATLSHSSAAREQLWRPKMLKYTPHVEPCAAAPVGLSSTASGPISRNLGN